MKKLFFLSALSVSLLLNAQEVLNGEEVDINITPVLHSSMVIECDGTTIFVDPYGGAGRWAPYGPADIILITHGHGDHFDKETLLNLNYESAILIAPEVVMKQLDTLVFKEKVVMENGQKATKGMVVVEAVPMYNLPQENARHKKGVGNGYVLTIDGKRLYISGDTGGIDEMRNLQNVDVAFICMNLPYTMTPEEAAKAVLAFEPKVVYPFHYRQKDGFADIKKFKTLVQSSNPKIDVRLRNWYPTKPE